MVGEDVKNEEWLDGGVGPSDSAKFSLFRLDLPAEGDVRRQLVSWAPKRQRPEFGTERQSLELHVGLVEKYAREIAGRLPLRDEVHEALGLAAKFHDKGKDRPAWQRAVRRKPGEEPVGKSGGSMDRIPGGYRHEFGSLREFTDQYEGKIANHVFDLAMHLIATHHGRGRPHFPKGGFDPEDRAQSERIATEAIRRFARLQRRYGYWRLAWLENLLRCADAMASSDRTRQL
jgi:CRISPR-associated endonuclease/helicase Cas3